MLVDGYPRSPPWRDPAFKGSPVVALLKHQLPAAVLRAFPALDGRYIVKGSAGQSSEALDLYALLNQSGGWLADDDILREDDVLQDPQAAIAAELLEQAKRYAPPPMSAG
jgi:hypothetical protein